jgi:hypothetical protein
MRRIRTALASASIAALAATSLAGAAPAEAKWKKLECVPGQLSGTKLCFYRDTKNSSRAKGRFVNHSGVDLKTLGVFWRYNTTDTVGCAEAITESGTTSRCIRTLPRGNWYVGVYVWYRSEYVGFTATNPYRFGF